MEMKLELSKEEFLKIYNQHKPNFLVRSIYNLFGGKLNEKPYPWGVWISILCFVIATIGMIYGDQTSNKELANKFVYLYLGFVVMFPLSLYAFLTNNSRQRKIASKLGMTIDEYNEYCKLYL